MLVWKRVNPDCPLNQGSLGNSILVSWEALRGALGPPALEFRKKRAAKEKGESLRQGTGLNTDSWLKYREQREVTLTVVLEWGLLRTQDIYSP